MLSPELLTPAIAGSCLIWFVAWCLLMIESGEKHPPYYASYRHSTKARARLQITAWFFPIAGPVWLIIFVVTILWWLGEYFIDLFKNAFGKEA